MKFLKKCALVNVKSYYVSNIFTKNYARFNTIINLKMIEADYQFPLAKI